jgi:hypothetical protein
MNANSPSLSEIRNAASRDMADEKMQQVRELLVGDTLRRMEAHLAYLDARINEMESVLSRQIDALETRMGGLTGTAESDRRTSFEALAQSVSELGDQIRRISRG